MVSPVRKIIHVDCDCFYASIEMRDDPGLRGIPMAVGGQPGKRGVIATCNYEARAFGVRSAMASAQALKLCPSLKIMPGNMDKYRTASQQIHQILQDYTELIEPLSLDEAYLDVTDCKAHQGSATLIAEEVRRRVRETVGITISAGVAPNKFLAKIASDWQKPDGLTVIRPEQVAAFVEQLPVAKLHGVGPATAARLKSHGIEKCSDLRRFSQLALVERMGSFGERLFDLGRGIDNRPVKTSRRRKSLSVEHTFEQDINGLDACLEKLPALMDEFLARLSRLDSSYRIAGVVVKVKFDDFEQTTVEQRAPAPDIELYRQLMEQGYARRNRPVRLLGLGVRLADRAEVSLGRQLSLFN